MNIFKKELYLKLCYFKKFGVAFLIILFAVAGAWAIEGNPYGECGKGVNWKFENGTLTISGTGSMDNSSAYSQNRLYSHSEQI